MSNASSCTAALLSDIRAQLAPDDTVLKEGKERRDVVRDAAEKFNGALRSFCSGSLAHGTANCPIHQRDRGLDGDCGVVLDRRYYPDLGPDSAAGVGPVDIVDEMVAFVTEPVKTKYAKARFKVTKRAILVTFSEPLPTGEDPTVDLVVGLNRKDEPGLWIPNTEKDFWDPSDPETHTALLTDEPKSLRVTRARAIRLAKAENRRTATPPLCSFNVEALGLMFVEPGLGEPRALLALWRQGAADLRRRLTPDPAGVSAPIKIEDRLSGAARLGAAADRLEKALERDWDAEWVRSHLQPLWPEFVPTTGGGETKARLAAGLQAGSPIGVTSTGALSVGAGAGLKNPRSFGA
jgi:hypothetical protein